jgi:hypothetical protein
MYYYYYAAVWFGNGHQGNQDWTVAGCNGIAWLPPEVVGLRDRYLTGLVEPCGALPRKCLFIYLFGAERAKKNNNNNNNTFTWSGPSGVLGCTGQRPVGSAAEWCTKATDVALCH